MDLVTQHKMFYSFQDGKSEMNGMGLCCGTIFLHTVTMCYPPWFNKELNANSQAERDQVALLDRERAHWGVEGQSHQPDGEGTRHAGGKVNYMSHVEHIDYGNGLI